MKKKIFLLLTGILAFLNVTAQEADSNATSNYLHVYLDGANDWENYIKVKLWYVDYVRDTRLSQVHVLITSQPTAAGGSKYSVMFFGRNNFAGKNDTLRLMAGVGNSNRQTRDELTNVITMGLMPYLAANGQQKYMFFDYTNKNKLIQQSIDKWKNWVFTTTVNSNFNSNQSADLFSGDGSFAATKITDKWKHRFTVGMSLSNNSYETATYSYIGTTLIRRVNLLTVKSINQHWSLGLEPAFYASTYSNVKSQFSLAPGIEYNLFPYSESVNHLFTLKYRVQPLYNTYIDSTVFFRTSQFLINHVFDITYTRIAPWGNISTTLTASQFLNHTKAYRIDLINQMNFRITTGLFFNVTGTASLINNQLSISKAKYKLEQILLQQREILSYYSYGIQVGIRYIFGSIYNNIVNPRYDGGVNISPEVSNVEGAD